VSKRSTKHATFTIERSFAVPPARVFAAYADAKAKARWFVGPDEWEKSNLKLDFRVGGRETVSGGPPGGPAYGATAEAFELAFRQLEAVETAARQQKHLVATDCAARAQFACEAPALAQQPPLGVAAAFAHRRELRGDEREA